MALSSLLTKISESSQSDNTSATTNNTEGRLDEEDTVSFIRVLNSIRETEDGRADVCLSGIFHSLVGCLLVNLNFTMHIAFFPKSSKERGLSSISIGAIFSIFQICFLVTTFLTPKLLKKLDIWTALKCSIGLHAVVTGLFAFTGRLQNPDAFFFSTMILRGIEGVLAASTEGAAQEVIKSSVPPVYAGGTVSFIETARTWGIVMGPLTGGGMHHVTGYKGPFIFLGCCLIALFLSSLLFPVNLTTVTTSSDSMKKDLIEEMLKLPIFMLMVAVIFISCSAITFLEPTLQPMVAEAPYSLNEVQMALVYLCLVTMYGISAQTAPVLALKLGTLPTIIFGMIFISAGFFVVCPPKKLSGPLSLFAFLHQSSKGGAIGLLIAGLCLMGLGGGFSLISASLMMVEEAEYNRIYTGESMGALSQIVNILYNFGNVLGPFTAGILEETAGFSKASSIIAFAVLIGAIITAITTTIILNRRPTEDISKTQVDTESETIESPLLANSEHDTLQ